MQLVTVKGLRAKAIVFICVRLPMHCHLLTFSTIKGMKWQILCNSGQFSYEQFVLPNKLGEIANSCLVKFTLFIS